MALWSMRTPDQVKRDFVDQWLAKANQDLFSASILLKGEPVSLEAAAFHAQQAVEKFMKAFLVRHQVEFPKTHNIAMLKTLIEKVDGKLAGQLARMETLTAYGVEYRYPGVYDPVSKKQGEEALDLANQAHDLILALLGPYLKEKPGGGK